MITFDLKPLPKYYREVVLLGMNKGEHFYLSSDYFYDRDTCIRHIYNRSRDAGVHLYHEIASDGGVDFWCIDIDRRAAWSVNIGYDLYEFIKSHGKYGVNKMAINKVFLKRGAKTVAAALDILIQDKLIGLKHIKTRVDNRGRPQSVYFAIGIDTQSETVE